MNYVNAKDVLPPKLLCELQAHLAGGLLYIPKKDTQRTGWGQANGTRLSLNRRNRSIIAAYQSGSTISELMDTHCLSESSIRKIVFSRGA